MSNGYLTDKVNHIKLFITLKYKFIVQFVTT